MALVLVAVASLVPGHDAAIHERLTAYKNDCRPLPNMWIIDTGQSVEQVYTHLTELLTERDRCVVARLEGTGARTAP